jgi:hypothetical protein
MGDRAASTRWPRHPGFNQLIGAGRPGTTDRVGYVDQGSPEPVRLFEAARRAALSSARVFRGASAAWLQLPRVTVASSALVPNAASSNGRVLRVIDQRDSETLAARRSGPFRVCRTVRSRLRLTLQLGPPVSVLPPIGGRHPQCPVVGPGDHLLASGGT